MANRSWVLGMALLLVTACASREEALGTSSSGLTTASPGGPTGCTLTPEEASARGFPSADLTVGDFRYVNPAPTGMLALFNRSGVHLQIDSVAATRTVATSAAAMSQWSEYCVNLDEAALHADLLGAGSSSPGQSRMGVGEVGCRFKLSTETEFAPIRWGTDAQPTALAVPPGSCVFIGGAVGYDFTVRTRPATVGLFAARQPSIDHVFDCDGTLQATPWSPWRNETGRTLRVVGASTYAAAPEDTSAPAAGTTVDAACIYVLDETGAVASRFCSPDYPVNVRGELQIPLTEVPPGWWIAAQANHRCAPPTFRHWGWVAFLHVY